MLKDLYATNRTRLAENLRAANDLSGAVVLMKGHRPTNELDSNTMHAHMYREANFSYLFGVPNVYYDGLLFLESGRAILIDAFPENDHSNTRLDAAALERFGLEKVIQRFELSGLLINANVQRIYLHFGFDSYTDASSHCYDALLPAELERLIDRETLFPVLNTTRAVKSALELSAMAAVCTAASRGHEEAMRHCRPGMGEYQLAAVFFDTVSRLGEAEDWAYSPICGSGADCAILHYHENDKTLADGALVLCDMGTRSRGLCSDITSTFPVNGRFSPRQAEIYQLTLDAQLLAIGLIKPGIRFEEIQNACFRRILDGLRCLGLIRGDLEAMFAAGVHGTFMPHSLGHYIGFRTHDVGLQVTREELNLLEEKELKAAAEKAGQGSARDEALKAKRAWQEEERPRRKLKYQSVVKAILRENMVITIEPGIYFIPVLIKKAMENAEIAAFYDFEKIEAYRKEVGGVRIEDCVAVTESGARLLTNTLKSIVEIEAIMAQGQQSRESQIGSSNSLPA